MAGGDDTAGADVEIDVLVINGQLSQDNLPSLRRYSQSSKPNLNGLCGLLGAVLVAMR